MPSKDQYHIPPILAGVGGKFYSNDKLERKSHRIRQTNACPPKNDTAGDNIAISPPMERWQNESINDQPWNEMKAVEHTKTYKPDKKD